ncbi:MAG: DUF4249 domain-containing protein [Bacteroidota bacterium]
MKRFIYILASVLLIISSCTEKIDIELNDDKNSRLVIDGGITTDTTVHTIRLTRTTSYFKNEPAPKETGATVTITGGNMSYILTETSPGVYQTDAGAFGKFGETYTLNVTLKNGEKYDASAIIDTVALIDAVVYYYHPYWEEYVLLLYAQEPEGEGDNYYFNIYMDGKLDNDTLRETSFESDELIDGMYVPGLEFYWIDKTKITNDLTHIKVDMLSMSNEQYDYYLALMSETDWRGGPFDGPPANIPSNISNGGLGFFWASGIASYELDIIKEHE